MEDIAGRDLAVGDFIVYTDGGYNAPNLVYGWVTRLNEKTEKIWIDQATYDRQSLMKTRSHHDGNRWVSVGTDEPAGICLVNYTQQNRFQILN